MARRQLERSEIAQNIANVDMARAEHLLADLKRTRIARIGLGIATEMAIHRAQSIEDFDDPVIIRAEHIFIDGEYAFKSGSASA